MLNSSRASRPPRFVQAFSMEGQEELQLNAVSAVTNLSYYVVEGSALLQSHGALCEAQALKARRAAAASAAKVFQGLLADNAVARLGVER